MPNVIVVIMDLDPDKQTSTFLDRLGASGSLLCALHCALTPALLAAIPSLGLSKWFGRGFEIGFVSFVTALGLFSLLWGYRRHRAFRALALLLLGLVTLWAGVWVPLLHEPPVIHAVVMTVGGLLVSAAHIWNLRLNHWHVHDAHCAH